jgi:hypothetical protein
VSRSNEHYQLGIVVNLESCVRAGECNDSRLFRQQIIATIRVEFQQLKCTTILKLSEHFAKMTKATLCNFHIFFEGLLFEEWLRSIGKELV